MRKLAKKGGNMERERSGFLKVAGYLIPLVQSLPSLGVWTGLIKREVFAEIPPRVEYFLTKDGTELRKAISPLMTWASARI